MSKQFTLQYPFDFRGKNYTVLNARRPKVLDVRKFLKKVDSDPIKAMEDMIGDLCEVEGDVIANVDFADFPQMKAWVEDFLKLMLPASSD